MRTPHLLRVAEGPESFAALFSAARDLGLRLGWLELYAPGSEGVGAGLGLPQSLEAAAGEGALRAVSVGAGRMIAVKPMKGAPVLRDLLREHFRGTALVLVCGEVEAPRLVREGQMFRVASAGRILSFDAARLAAALRKPRPWGDEVEAGGEPAAAL